MRDLPLSLSVGEFARHLQCGVDAAKRWLAGTSGRRWTETKKSEGGHWTVKLPHGDYSILACRLQRSLDKIFDRKPYASTAMPLDLGASAEGNTGGGAWEILCGIDAPWMRQDLGGLFFQMAQELKLPVEKLLHESEKKMTEALAWLVLLQAGTRLRQTDKKLTVSTLAKTLNFSVASLYRKPFRRDLVQEVLLALKGRIAVPTIAESEALANGLNQRSRQEIRTYDERKPGRERARRAKARHFLCWHALDGAVGRQATLRLVPEEEVPPELRPNYSPPPSRIALPKYAAAELKGILSWLEYNVVLEGLGIANVSPNEDGVGYRWYFNEGQYQGQSESWDIAAAAVLKLAGEVRFRRALFILNPTKNGVYEVPLYLSGQRQEAASGPAVWVRLERDMAYEKQEADLRRSANTQDAQEHEKNRFRERGVLHSSRGFRLIALDSEGTLSEKSELEAQNCTEIAQLKKLRADDSVVIH